MTGTSGTLAPAGVKNNLDTYQGQEFTEDLGLNTHEWRYRVSDPTIGRFWQIDPLAEKYTYNSTYAFQENKMGMGVELEGLELTNFTSPNVAASHINEIRNGPFRQEAEVAGAISFFGGLAALAGVTFGVKASLGFIANEVKDEAISQATGGLSDFVDLTKIGKNVVEAGIKKIKNHLSNPDLNLDPDVANDVMLDRLEKIKNGEIDATSQDTNYFNHEIRESEHVANGLNYDEAHVQTLKDQGIEYKTVLRKIFTLKKHYKKVMKP